MWKKKKPIAASNCERRQVKYLSNIDLKVVKFFASYMPYLVQVYHTIMYYSLIPQFVINQRDTYRRRYLPEDNFYRVTSEILPKAVDG